MTTAATATATTSDLTRPPSARPARPQGLGRNEMSAAEAAFFGPSRAGDPAEKDLSFGDLLDVINPLQHIPLVSTLYRAITGDAIGAPARVVGGALYGGLIGAGVAIASAIVEEASGKDPGAQVMAALGIGDGPAPAPTAIAETTAGPGGLIAEATTAAAAPATVAAATPPAATAAAAGGMPHLSPAAFDALVRSVGGTPTADAAPPATAAAGSTDTRRFYPARQTGAKPTRPVPMDIRPADKSSYEDALRLMRENMERYAGASAAPASLAAP